MSRETSLTAKAWRLLSPAERHSAILLLVSMVVSMALETLGVGVIVPAVAVLTQADFASNYPALQPLLHFLGNPTQQQLVLWGMVGLVGVYFVKVAFLAFLAWQQTKFGYDIQVRVSQDLFARYLRQPYTFHLQHNSAELIRNVVTEVGLLVGRGILPAMVLLTEAMVIVGVFALLIFYEPVGAIVVMLVLGSASWLFHQATSARLVRWGRARQHHEGLRIQHLQQGLGGAKDVKLLGRESDFLEQYRPHNVESARVALWHGTLQQIPRLWLELLAVGGLAILVLSMMAQHRAADTVVPMLGLFAAAAFRLIPSVNRILQSTQSLKYGLPVIDVLDREMRLVESPNARLASGVMPFRESIELRGVTFTYAGSARPALRGVTLAVRRGETVGFIGTSGSGKSTLVDVVLGLLAPERGEVCVDGVNIQTNIRNWQDQIGYVPQTIFLTDDTLRRNVAFGLPREEIDDAAVLRAVKAAQLEEFIARLPEGLETVVGERGVRLSGGQRQRVGIARALYHDPAVLVLDEATSALDTATERGVMQAVTALHGTKTILIVAHRYSTVEHCDRLYRIERGTAEPVQERLVQHAGGR